MNHHQLIREGLSLLPDLTTGRSPVVGQTAVIYQVASAPQMAAYLIAQRQDEPALTAEQTVKLSRQMDHHFDKADLRDLCFKTNINHEDLPELVPRELIYYLARRNQLNRLLALLPVERPNVNWPVLPAIDPIATSEDLAILVNLASRQVATMPLDVARYLDRNLPQPANILLLQKPQENKNIELDGHWQLFLSSFQKAVSQATQLSGAGHFHLFLSGLGPMLFGMGCMWGTVKDATIYHLQNGQYHPVITIDRSLHS